MSRGQPWIWGQGNLESKLDMHALPPSAQPRSDRAGRWSLGKGPSGALGGDQGSSLGAVRALLPGKDAIQDSGNGHSPDTEGTCSLILNFSASELQEINSCLQPACVCVGADWAPRKAGGFQWDSIPCSQGGAAVNRVGIFTGNAGVQGDTRQASSH